MQYEKIKILTTSPSIDVNHNVSGISNLTRLWIENNNEVEYIVFEAGKKDRTKRNLNWLFKQPFILISFLITFKKYKIDIVHINMPLEKMAIIRESCFVYIAWLISKPIIIHIRGGFYNKNEQTPNYLKILIKGSLKKAKQIIVLGDDEKLFFSNYYHIRISKITSLPNCVKINDYNKKERNNQLNILFLGRLDKNKGLNEIIKSLISLPSTLNYSFFIAGDGPDKEWFLNYCKKAIPNKFQYFGVVSGREKEDLLKSSHIFLLPSYYEGLPNALLEAMSNGVVPIVTPVGSISEVVKHQQNGILVKIKDENSISDALIQLYYNFEFYNKLSTNAHQNITHNYSLDKYLQTLNKLYIKLYNKKTNY